MNKLNQKIITKLHRWLAFTVGIFIIFQSASGTIAQKRFELMQFSSPSDYRVEQIAPPASPKEIFISIKEQKPDINIAHVMMPSRDAPNSAVIIMGGRDPDNPHDSSRIIAFDQYSKKVITEHSLRDGWVGAVTLLHRWVLFGKTGMIIVSILGILTLLMSVSGLYLFFKTRKTTKQLPLLTRVHRSAGFILSVFLISASLTGIIMSLSSWQAKTSGKSVFSNLMSQSSIMAQHGDKTVDPDVAYSIAIQSLPSNQLLSAFSYAGEHSPNYWFAFFDNRMFRNDVLVDASNGKIVGIYPSGVTSGGDGPKRYLFPIHSGHFFGKIGGTLMNLSGALIIFWLISGIIIYKRKS
jgi:uncharacterized iron-regulated membrane protein